MGFLGKVFNVFKAYGSAKDSQFVGASYIDRRLRGWNPASGAPDRDFSSGTQEALRSRSRDLYRNNPIARAVVDRFVTGVIGTGFYPIPCAPNSNEIIDNGFENWCGSCDFFDEHDFFQLQRIAYNSQLVSGDCFVNTPSSMFGSLKIQLIESDRVCNENLTIDDDTHRRGIILNDEGRPIYISIMRKHPGEFIPEYSWQTIPIFDEYGFRRVLQCFYADRPDQHRGVPILAPVLELVNSINKYRSAEMVAAHVSSLLTFFVKSPGLGGMPSRTQPLNQDEVELAPGAIINLAPGEEIQFANPSRPNSAFKDFVRSLYVEIGAGVGLPAEIMLSEFNSSYSAARAAMMLASKVFDMHKANFIAQFCRPIYNLYIRHLFEAGVLKDEAYFCDPNTRAKWQKARWIGPAQGSIDEKADIESAKARVEAGISTLQQETEALTGRDWKENMKQRELEHKMRASAGLEPQIIIPVGAGEGTLPEEKKETEDDKTSF